VQLAYTHFSPSAESFASGLKVDFRDYLPFDTAPAVGQALDALRPTALVFAKLDVWPRLVMSAEARGVAVGMVSATLPASSSRRSGAAAAFLRDAYGRLAAVGAIDADDAGRLVDLGVRPGAIEVTGDTRYDQVWSRAASVDRQAPLLATLASDRPTLVAGSTWAADEAQLLAAWLDVRTRHPGVRLVIAPHEPTPAHLDPIERWAKDHGLILARLGATGAATAEVVLVDRVGVLGELYALADVAFVGGGFHRAGLHSVLEPAAYGAPVLFGPYHAGSRDAGLLIAAGGAFAAADAGALSVKLGELLGSAADRQAAGSRAIEVVRAGLGAAERSYALIERLLGG
jgi:3-deoxy-D-manno-octulosonic-acid transferase